MPAQSGAPIPYGQAEALVIPFTPCPTPMGFAGDWVYREIFAFDVTPLGGWTASVRMVTDDLVSESTYRIVGQRDGQLDGPVEIFELPVGPTDPAEDIPYDAALTGNSIAFLYGDASAPLDQSQVLRLGNQEILRQGDPVQGASLPLTWTFLRRFDLGTNGHFIMEGEAYSASLDRTSFVVADVTAGTVLLDGFDFFPGIPRRLQSYRAFSTSPDGAHWSASVQTRLDEEWFIIMDGAAYEWGPGFVAREGTLVPEVIGADPGSIWVDFNTPRVNDAGDIAFLGSYGTPSGAGATQVIRNGRPVVRVFEAFDLIEIDQTGAALCYRTNSSFDQISLDGNPILPPQLTIDVDRDGIAEPFANTTFLLQSTISTDSGPMYMKAYAVTQPSSSDRVTLLRMRDHSIDSGLCDGELNSTGQAAELLVTGSPLATDNDTRVLAMDLPAASSGYLLVSRNVGTPFQPPGSAGFICLGGPIGRLQSDLFTTDIAGIASVTLDLAALPQPTGAVAVLPGDTWHVQGWFRDVEAGMATSNFTAARSIIFR